MLHKLLSIAIIGISWSSFLSGGHTRLFSRRHNVRPVSTALDMGDISHISTLSTSLSAILTDVKSIHFSFSEYAFSGAVAGGFRALSRAVTFPFDTMKTVTQVQRGNTRDPSYKQYSVRELFRGVIPAVVVAIPANAVFFIIYNYLLTFAASESIANLLSLPHDSRLLLIERLLFSSIATLPSNLIKTPAELLKQRAQVQPDASLISLIRDATKPPNGFRGLFLGNNAQLLRELPYNAIQMTTFDFMRDVCATPPGMDFSTHSALLGFVAAGVAAVLTQPADTVKTRLMAGQVLSYEQNRELMKTSSKTNNNRLDIGHTSKLSNFRPAGIVEITKQIIDEKGFEGLFIGMKYRVALVSFGGLVYFWTAAIGQEWFSLRFSN